MSHRILTGDCRDVLGTLSSASVHCCVTSPPYFGLRDYGVAGQIGLEQTPDAYVAEMVAVFREVRRVLRDDGTLWLNLGDSYSNIGRQSEKRDKDASGVVRPTAEKLCERCGKSFFGGHTRRFCSAFCGGSDNSKRVHREGRIKAKDLIGIPWRVAFALQADGWWLRSSIIWHKPNPMPESVTDRPTSAHENIFLLSKAERYFFDAEAVLEPFEMPKGGKVIGRGVHGSSLARSIGGQNSDRSNSGGFERTASGRNIRNVWTIATEPFSEAHFATFPPALIEPCIKAGCPKGGTVLDPFFGAGTTGLVADRLGRNCIGIELNPEYAAMARRRLERDAGMFATVSEAAE